MYTLTTESDRVNDTKTKQKQQPPQKTKQNKKNTKQDKTKPQQKEQTNKQTEDNLNASESTITHPEASRQVLFECQTGPSTNWIFLVMCAPINQEYSLTVIMVIIFCWANENERFHRKRLSKMMVASYIHKATRSVDVHTSTTVHT